MSEPWVIRKSGAFYRADYSGYTIHPEAAGIYTREEAEREASIEPKVMSAHPLSEFRGELQRNFDLAKAALEKADAAIAQHREGEQMTQPIEKIDPIPRGADLTDDDLRLIVEDFYVVRNWAALKMRMGVAPMKEHLLQALQVRLGRRLQRGDFSKPRVLTPGEVDDLRSDARATSAECKRLIAQRCS